MDLQISLTLTTPEKEALVRALRTTDTELTGRLAAYAKAAAEEYVVMFLGQKVFSRGSDILEHRLFLMIKYALDGKIPDEQLVSALFQCTHSQSRSLLRSVMAKYRFQLLTKGALKKVLDTIKKDEGRDHFVITINQEAILSELNSILAFANGSLIQITKKIGKSTEYEIRESSYEKLCENLGITKKTLT